ncbi:MAG TPA: hypothetical protein VHC94_11010 [Nitrobacter sp.]|nr:hypothetical protein [Nitrobacter sp.]
MAANDDARPDTIPAATSGLPPEVMDAIMQRAAELPDVPEPSPSASSMPTPDTSGSPWSMGAENVLEAGQKPVADVISSAALGVVKAGLETKDVVSGIAGAVTGGTIGGGEPKESEKSGVRKWIESTSDDLRRENMLNGVAQGVTQFGVGFIGLGKIGLVARGLEKAAEVGRLAHWSAEAGRAAVAGGVVMDPHEERLSNLVQQYPALQNPISAYLAAKPDDSAAEGRLKNALESEESEARLQQERQDKLAANQAKHTIVEQILKDPNAPIDEQQLAPILKLDGNFKLDLMKWRDDIRTRNVTDDPAKVSLLYQDILAGGGDGMDKITSAIRSGDVRNPDDIRQAITFAKTIQDYGQRPDGILNTSAAKSYLGQIQVVGTDSKMSQNRVFGDPPTLTDDGRTALNNYRYGLMQWQTQNPNASALEREQYATSLGESILKHFQPGQGKKIYEKTYTPPPSVQDQPQAQPLSVDQTPAAAAQVLQRMQTPQAAPPQVPSTPAPQATQGTGQPSSAPTVSTNPLYQAMSP